MIHKLFKSLITLLLFTILLQPHFAFSSGQEGKGGDVRLIRKTVIENFIKYDLKESAKKLMIRIEPSLIRDTKLVQIMTNLKNSGVLEDINQSDYQIKDSCKDFLGNAKSAVANDLERNGPICFDTGRLAQQGVSKSELLGLAIHEHAHHFHFDDADDLISSFITKTIDEDFKLALEILPGEPNPNATGTVCIGTLLQNLKNQTWNNLPGEILGSGKISEGAGNVQAKFLVLYLLPKSRNTTQRAIILNGVIQGYGYFRFSLQEVDVLRNGFVTLANPTTLIPEQVFMQFYQEEVPSRIFITDKYQLILSCVLTLKQE